MKAQEVTVFQQNFLNKYKGEKVVESIHKLLLKIWDQKVFLEEWNLRIICTIHKKGDIWECSIYRGVTLLYTAIREFSKILCLRPFAKK